MYSRRHRHSSTWKLFAKAGQREEQRDPVERGGGTKVPVVQDPVGDGVKRTPDRRNGRIARIAPFRAQAARRICRPTTKSR
jgi:hypothetical protein